MSYLRAQGFEGTEEITEDMSIIDMVTVLMATAENLESLDIIALLSFINASVVIDTTSNGETNTLLGIYMVDGSIFVDLTGLDMPCVDIDADTINGIIAENREAIDGFLAGILGGDSEAETAEGEEEVEEGIAFPLLSEELAGYIKTFVEVIRMRSTFVQVVLTSNYINEILAIAFKDADVDLKFNEEHFTKNPYIQVNFDINEGKPLAELMLPVFDNEVGVSVGFPGLQVSTANANIINKPEGEFDSLFESKMTVSASVEFELSISEGKIDIGTILANILGDLSGLELEIPALDGSQGITAAHFRLDLAMLVDFSNPANSELSIELYNITDLGAVNLWVSAYYTNDTFYIYAPSFNVPKMSITTPIVSEFINNTINGLLNGEAQEDEAEAASDVVADALVVVSNHQLSVAISNKLILAVVDMLLGGLDINEYVKAEILAAVKVDATYDEELTFNANVDLSVNDTDIKLALAVKDVDYSFTTADVSIFDEADLAGYTEVTEIERIAVTEKIDLSLAFTEDQEIDLSKFIAWLLPDLADEDLKAIVQIVSNEGEVTSIEATIALEVKFAELMSYLRAQGFEGTEEITEDMSIIDMVTVLMATAENLESLDIIALLSFINASVVIDTTSNGETNTLLGIYMVDGSIFVDLTGLDMPCVDIDADTINGIIAENREAIDGFLAGILGGDSEAETAEGEEEVEEGIAFPLLSEELAGYIKTFVEVIRMRSTFVQVVLTSNYINEILAIAFKDADVDLKFNEEHFTKNPYIQVNFDINEGKPLAELMLPVFDNEVGVSVGFPGLQVSTANANIINKPEGEFDSLFESKMTVSASVEFELSISEGKIDIGTILANILGDLSGLELEIPALDGSQGITAAHFRLDLAMLVDFSNPANSELSIELYNITDLGAVNLWVSAYYTNDTFYIYAPSFNVPKMSITTPIVSEFINNTINGLLNGEAQEDEAEAASDVVADALVVVSNHQLSVAISNKLILAVVDMLLGGLDINEYVKAEILAAVKVDATYDEELTFNANVDLSVNDTDIKLALAVKDVDYSFTTADVSIFDEADLAGYTEVTEIERIAVTEKIDLSLAFTEDQEIDLSMLRFLMWHQRFRLSFNRHSMTSTP